MRVQYRDQFKLIEADFQPVLNQSENSLCKENNMAKWKQISTYLMNVIKFFFTD